MWQKPGLNPTKPAIVCVVVLTVMILACSFSPSVSPTPGPHDTSTVFSLIYWGKDPHYAINVVFVPGNGYDVNPTSLASRQLFVTDLAAVISKGFYNNNAIAKNITKFNFWYTTATAFVQQPADKDLCPIVQWPSTLNTDLAFADVIIAVHKNSLRDCEWGGRIATYSIYYPFTTAVHEFSHAAFGIPDEYCCDGGYWNIPPILYDSQAACAADATNAAWRNCQSFTDIHNRTWWRSEGPTSYSGHNTPDNAVCDIMNCWPRKDQIVEQYGPADWVILKLVLLQLDPGLFPVNDPAVFAPNDWVWP
jgi:hypothetical protein